MTEHLLERLELMRSVQVYADATFVRQRFQSLIDRASATESRRFVACCDKGLCYGIGVNRVPSLQETHAPQGRCFGCGPANAKGLRIQSFPSGDSADATVVCDWTPERHHEAFENVLNGGIIGAVLDCHMNWTTAFHLMKKNQLDHAPCCVTAEFKVVLKRPTPMGPVHVEARVVSSESDRATIEAKMVAGPDKKVTAIGTGTFVAVKPDHPAYHRW
jgi:acyl-coenzyme A thioesterase PaaI-like protein